MFIFFGLISVGLSLLMWFVVKNVILFLFVVKLFRVFNNLEVVIFFLEYLFGFFCCLFINVVFIFFNNKIFFLGNCVNSCVSKLFVMFILDKLIMVIE